MPRITRKNKAPDARTPEDKKHANDIRPDIVAHVREKITIPRKKAQKKTDNRKMIAVAPETHAELLRISIDSEASIPSILALMLEDFKSKF